MLALVVVGTTRVIVRPARAKTNEVFVADGYGNRRVIVFDADTGAYKRHWGAYRVQKFIYKGLLTK